MPKFLILGWGTVQTSTCGFAVYSPAETPSIPGHRLLIENFGGMKACHCYPSADFPTQDYSLPSGRISEPANSPAAATTCPLHRTAFRMVGRSRLIVDRPSHEILRRLIRSLGSLRTGGICADSSSASVTLLFSQQGTFRKFPLKSSFWALFCLLDATEIRE